MMPPYRVILIVFIRIILRNPLGNLICHRLFHLPLDSLVIRFRFGQLFHNRPSSSSSISASFLPPYKCPCRPCSYLSEKQPVPYCSAFCQHIHICVIDGAAVCLNGLIAQLLRSGARAVFFMMLELQHPKVIYQRAKTTQHEYGRHNGGTQACCASHCFGAPAAVCAAGPDSALVVPNCSPFYSAGP